MISIEGIKTYLLSKGFKIDGTKFVKEYPMPHDESELEKVIKIKYVIDRPWIKGFRIDSVGREVLFSKGKLKELSIDVGGNIVGFKIKKTEGGKTEWI